MIEQLMAAVSRRPLLGVAISLAVHAVLLLALLWVPPGHKPVQKRGDTLIVDLPNLDEPANRGTPGPAADDPPAPSAPPPRPAARPAPPTPKAVPAPRAPATVRSTPNAEPRDAPRAVARAAQPPPSVERGEAPPAKSVPQPATDAARATVDPTTPAPEPSRPELPTPPAVASAPPTPPGAARPDIRSALRRGGVGGGSGLGGAGGSGVGRGGFLGEPVPLDTKDPDFTDYFSRIRPMIERAWIYPCATGKLLSPECRRREGVVFIEFGIGKSGRLEHIELKSSSGNENMDVAALNALKLASPYPPVPAALVKGAGVLVLGRFRYILQEDMVIVLPN